MKSILVIALITAIVGVVGAQIQYDDMNPIDVLQYSAKVNHAPIQLSGISPDSAKAMAVINEPLWAWHPEFNMTLGYLHSEWNYFNQGKDDVFGISPFGKAFLVQNDRIPASVISK